MHFLATYIFMKFAGSVVSLLIQYM